jgi:hypothetical protein
VSRQRFCHFVPADPISVINKVDVELVVTDETEELIQTEPWIYLIVAEARTVRETLPWEVLST